MRKAMLVLSLSMLGPGYRTTAGEAQWQYMPLRTAAQKAKGYLGGETGQMFFCGAFSPSSPDYVAIGLDTAQTYISDNGGNSWKMRSRGILSNGVQSVAFDPRNKDILFAFGLNAYPRTPDRKIIRTAEGLRGFRGHRFGGIYRSVDCGRSWKLMFRAMILRDRAQNQYFAFDPKSFDGIRCRTIYAGSHNQGLLKSTDGGETWESLGLEYKHINAVLIHPKDNRLLFIAAHGDLYRSDDAGTTFRTIGRGLPPEAPVSGLALNTKNENVLYVALHKAGVWWSTDGGRTFTPRDNGLQKHEWRRLAISPVNPNILYVQADRVTSNTSIQCSRDGGETWHPIGKWEPQMIGNHPQYGGYFAEGIIPHPTEAETALTLSRIHKTTDAGRSWQHSADGVSGCRFTAIAFRPDEPKTFIVFYTDHGASVTHDNGDTFAWLGALRKFHPMSCGPGAIDPTPGAKRIITSVGGWSSRQLILSEDNGATWKVVQPEKQNYGRITFHRQKPSIVYVNAGQGGLRSDDGGGTWKPMTHSPQAVCRDNCDILFSTVYSEKNSRFLKSIDGGLTWNNLPGSVPGRISTHGGMALECDPRDGSRLYACAGGSVWVFDGRAWRERNTEHGLQNDAFGGLMFTSLAVDPTRPNIIYAGQNRCWMGRSGGIFRSTDFGGTWTNITRNLGPWLTVWSLAVSPHDGTVYVGTDYGTWRLPCPQRSIQ